MKLIYGGESGIRTHGRFDPTPDFESGTFDHSAISPNRISIIAFGYFLDFLLRRALILPGRLSMVAKLLESQCCHQLVGSSQVVQRLFYQRQGLSH